MNRNVYCFLVFVISSCLLLPNLSVAQSDRWGQDQNLKSDNKSEIVLNNKTQLLKASVDREARMKGFSLNDDFQKPIIVTKNIELVDFEKRVSESSFVGKNIEVGVVQSNLAKIVSSTNRGEEACPQPTALLADNVSRTSASLGWKSNGTGTSWEVEVLPSGGTPTESGDVVETNPYVVTGLTPNTAYDFYVRELCEEASTGEGELIITGIIDGPLVGGTPKALELTAIGTISALDKYGVGIATNGNPNGGVSFTFPEGSLEDGEAIYLTRDSATFADFFEFSADFVSGSAPNFNGDDVVLLFRNDTIVDVFGEEGVDGTGEAWDYMDGWAYRMDLDVSNGGVFDPLKWTYSGPNALDNETTNATSATPFPTNTYEGPALASEIASLWSGPETFTTEAGNVDNCFAGTLSNTDIQLVCPGETATVTTNGDELVPGSGTYGWLFTRGAGATGGIAGPDFTITGPANYVFDNNLNGSLSGAGLPRLKGLWQVRGLSNATGTISDETTCGYTGTAATIIFREELDCQIDCDAGTLDLAELQEICPGEIATVSNNGDANVPENGGYAFQFTPGDDGAGGNGVLHIVTVPANSLTYNSNLNGLLSNLNLDPFIGTWYIRGLAYSDDEDVEGSICDITSDSIVVIFKDSVDCLGDSCNAGTLANTNSISICPLETFDIATNGDEIIPEGGTHSWLLAPGEGATGGLNDTFSITGFETAETFDNDLNGLLSLFSLDRLEGTWRFYSQVSSDTIDVDGSVCSTSIDFREVTFLTFEDEACEVSQDTCVLFGGGPFFDFINPPCDDDCGTPVAPEFEVFENEAYVINCTAGSQYTFEFCSGYSEETWSAAISVSLFDEDSDAAIEGSTIAYVEGCSITFEAEVDGEYILVVSEIGNCGGAWGEIGNGFPTLDCGPEGATCEVFGTDSLCIEFETGFFGPPYFDLFNPPCNEDCGTPVVAEFEVWGNEGYVINATAGSEYTVEFCEGYDETNWEGVIVVALLDTITGTGREGTVIANASGCSITFTTPTTDLYIVVITAKGNCGGPTIQVDNGILSIDCGPNGATCPIDCEETGPTISLEDVQDETCSGDGTGSITIDVLGGTGEIDIEWSNGDSLNSISGLTDGEYTVMVTDANGCFDVLTVEVSSASAITATLDSVTSASVGLDDGIAYFSIAAGNPDYSVQYTSDDSTTTGAFVVTESGSYSIADLAVGNYVVLVTDSTGCQATLEFAVRDISCESSDISFTYTSTPEDCNLDNGTVTIIPSGGVAPYTYGWPELISTENEPTANNLSEGIFIFTLIDNNGCDVSDTIFVGSNKPLISVALVTPVSCVGENDGAIDITVNQGSSPFTFEWSNGEETEDISGLTSGFYTVTVTDSVGCETTKSVQVNSPSSLEVTLDSTRSATSGNSNGAIFISVQGGVPDYTYVLDGDTVSISDLQALSSGEYSIVVVDDNGCESDELLVNVGEDVGVELLSTINALNIYPNPTRNKVNIYLDLDKIHDVELSLMSYDGKTLERLVADAINSNTFVLDLSKYNTGIYFVNIQIDGERIARKVSFIK